MLTPLRYPRRPLVISACDLATGRQCLALLATRYKADSAIIPSYCPEGVSAPLAAKAARGVVPYDLNPDLSPNIASVESALKYADVTARKILVVIHFFGYKMPARDLAALAHDYNAILVEDCAQALIGDASDANDGDVVLFSMNKFFPVCDGARLLSHRIDVDVSVTDSELPQLPATTQQHYMTHITANWHVAQAQSVDDANYWQTRSTRAHDAYYGHVSALLEPHTVSKFSAQQLERYSLAELMKTRTVAAKVLASKLPPKLLLREEGLPVFAFPIRCRGLKAEMIEALEASGVMPAVQRARWSTPKDLDFVDDHLLLPLNCTEAEAGMIAIVLNDFK